MKNYIIISLILLMSISAVSYAWAPTESDLDDLAKQLSTKDGVQKFVLKYQKQLDDDEFDLGTAIINGEAVHGTAFVHKKADKNEGFSHLKRGSSTASTCYSFTSGKKWRTKENWIVNPANSQGLSSTFLLNNVGADIQKWETAANRDIFSTGILTAQTLVADSSAPDGKNEVYFADVSTKNAIAVTIVWWNYYGIIEWDQIYDDVDFQWSSTGAPGKMDFENIATHEIGHAFGMGHPSSTCKEETMYYSAAYGETKKRSLNTGDITGIKKLYSV